MKNVIKIVVVVLLLCYGCVHTNSTRTHYYNKDGYSGYSDNVNGKRYYYDKKSKLKGWSE